MHDGENQVLSNVCQCCNTAVSLSKAAKSKHKDDRIWTHFVFCSSSKPNSSAMSERFGAMRFWSAYSSDAVSVKIVTM